MDKRSRTDDDDEENDRHFKRHSGTFGERPNGPSFSNDHQGGSNYRRSPYHQPLRGVGQRGERFDRGGRGSAEQEPSEEESLATLLFLLGDKSTRSLMSNLESMTQSILSLPSPSSIVPALVECCVCVNWKTNIYATLIGLLNNVNPALGKAILNTLRKSICHEMGQDCSPVSYAKIEIGLRVLGSLVNTNVLDAESWLQFCQHLLRPARSGQASSCLLVWILGTMPWNAWTLQSRASAKLNALVTDIGTLLKEGGFGADGEHSSWWRAILELRDAKKWNDALLFKPFVDFDFSDQHVHAIEELTEAESQGLQRLLASVPCPSWPVLRMTLHVPLSASSSSASHGDEDPFPEPGSLEAVLLYNMIRANLVLCSHNHRKCISLLTENLKFNKRFNMGRMIIFVILNELLQPDSVVGEKTIYYADLIVGSLASSAKIARAIGEMINKLFHMIVEGSLNWWQAARISEWWSLHLSHFGYKWKWENWQKVLEGLPQEPKGGLAIPFVRDLLARLTRLSYYERIKAILPDYFHSYMPSVPEPRPSFDFESGAGQAICQKIRAREAMPDMAMASGTDNSKWLVLEALMMVGSKSFSHSLNMIERYSSFLKEINASRQDQEATLDALRAFWSHHRQFLEIWLEKLVAYGVVDPNAVIEWIFKPANESMLVWDSSLWQTIERLVRRQKGAPNDVTNLILRKLYEKLLITSAQDSSESGLGVSSHAKACHAFGTLWAYRRIFPQIFTLERIQALDWSVNQKMKDYLASIFND